MITIGKCPSCGAEGDWTDLHDVSYEVSSNLTVDGISGKKCGICGEITFTDESYKKIEAAINKQSRQRNAAFVQNVRINKLNITQIEAVRVLSGGGHNAFSRYESGDVAIPKPLMVLMHLLDKHPELYPEIKNMRVPV